MSSKSQFLSLVRRVVKERSSLSQVSEALGRDRSWLGKGIRGERPFTFETLEKVLEILEIEPEEFFAEFLAPEIGFSSDIASRISKQLHRAWAPREDRPEIIGRLEEVRPERIPSGLDYRLPERFEYIAGLLRTDRRIALAEADTWLLEVLKYGLSNRAWEGAKAAELGVALAAWATVSRALGQVRSAVWALDMALDLHVAASTVTSFGPVLEVSARVLSDLGQTGLGFDCLREAYSLYAIHAERGAAGRTMVTIGIFATYQGLFHAAESALSQCARDKDLSSHLRDIALFNLGWTLLKSGHLENAREVLDSASIEDFPERDRFNFRWVEALVRRMEGADDMALEIFERLLSEASVYLDAIDHVLLFMDYSECCFQADEMERALRQLPAIRELSDRIESPVARDGALKALGEVCESALLHDISRATARLRRALKPGAAATHPLS